MRTESVVEYGGRRATARPLAVAGLVLGLGPPLLLLAPMFYYQMEFMLYTWVWPTASGAIGVFLSALALRRAERDATARRLALAGLAISMVTTGLALAGWIGMIGSMLSPIQHMPMDPMPLEPAPTPPMAPMDGG